LLECKVICQITLDQYDLAFCHVRHESDVTGSLDGYCQGSLVLGTVAANSAGQDFAALGDKLF
jgi:hypothetical protein